MTRQHMAMFSSISANGRWLTSVSHDISWDKILLGIPRWTTRRARLNRLQPDNFYYFDDNEFITNCYYFPVFGRSVFPHLIFPISSDYYSLSIYQFQMCTIMYSQCKYANNWLALDSIKWLTEIIFRTINCWFICSLRWSLFHQQSSFICQTGMISIWSEAN